MNTRKFDALILARRGDPGSEKVLELADRLGVNVRVVYVDDPGVAQSLHMLGTYETPALVTGRGIYPGARLAEAALRELARVSSN
ncbi:MAG: hypothetical protein QI223_08065 [Candidatus Korarchaeota archaeon]|nr:hypothetical protein [Candidatus Korarchaeota archaeon]